MKSEQIYFDPQICLLETANCIIRKLYETSCSELSDKYYQMRALLLESLRRSQEDDGNMSPMYYGINIIPTHIIVCIL